MDATDLCVAVQVGGDDDTVAAHCALCAARARVDELVSRAGVDRLTLVSNYRRVPFDRASIEETSALLARGGLITRGQGSSREEAIVSALAEAGFEL
jgi:hypothetical protein